VVAPPPRSLIWKCMRAMWRNIAGGFFYVQRRGGRGEVSAAEAAIRWCMCMKFMCAAEKQRCDTGSENESVHFHSWWFPIPSEWPLSGESPSDPAGICLSTGADTGKSSVALRRKDAYGSMSRMICI